MTRKRGRPPNAVKRSRSFRLQLSDDELDRLHMLAHIRQQNTSDVMRGLINKASESIPRNLNIATLIDAVTAGSDEEKVALLVKLGILGGVT